MPKQPLAVWLELPLVPSLEQAWARLALCWVVSLVPTSARASSPPNGPTCLAGHRTHPPQLVPTLARVKVRGEFPLCTPRHRCAHCAVLKPVLRQLEPAQSIKLLPTKLPLISSWQATAKVQPWADQEQVVHLWHKVLRAQAQPQLAHL